LIRNISDKPVFEEAKGLTVRPGPTRFGSKRSGIGRTSFYWDWRVRVPKSIYPGATMGAGSGSAVVESSAVVGSIGFRLPAWFGFRRIEISLVVKFDGRRSGTGMASRRRRMIDFPEAPFFRLIAWTAEGSPELAAVAPGDDRMEERTTNGGSPRADRDRGASG